MNYNFNFGFYGYRNSGSGEAVLPVTPTVDLERYYAPASMNDNPRLPIVFNGATSAIYGTLPYGDVRGDTDDTNSKDVEILQSGDIIKIPMETAPDINGDTVSYTVHLLSLSWRYNTRSPFSPVTFKSFDVRIETTTGDYRNVAASDFIDRLSEFKMMVYLDQRPNLNENFNDIFSIVEDLGSVKNGIFSLVPDLPVDNFADNGTVRVSFQEGVIPKFKITRTTIDGVPVIHFAEVQLSRADLRVPGQVQLSGDPWHLEQERSDRIFIDLEFDNGILDAISNMQRLPDRILFEEFYARDSDFPDGFTYPNNFSGEVSRISGMIAPLSSVLPADTATSRVRNYQPNNTQSTITMPGSGTGSARVPDYSVQLNQVVWAWTGDIVRINVIWLRIGNPAGDKTAEAAARNLITRLDELNASIFVDNKEETENFIDTFVSHTGLDLTANGNRFTPENNAPTGTTQFVPVMKTVNGVEVVDPDFYDLRLAYRYSFTDSPNPSNSGDVQTKISRTTMDNYFEIQLSRFQPRQLDLDIGNDLWGTSFTSTFADTHKVQLEFINDVLSKSGRIEVLQNEPIGAAGNISSTTVKSTQMVSASLATDGIIDFDIGPLRNSTRNLVLFRFDKSPEFSRIFLVNGTDGGEFEVTDQFDQESGALREFGGAYTTPGEANILIKIYIWRSPPIFGSDVRFLRLKP